MQGSGAVAGKLREWRYQDLPDKPLASGTGEGMKIMVWKESARMSLYGSVWYVLP